VKSPKVYIRDSGLVHALLGLRTFNDLAGHPVSGSSWEEFAIDALLAAAPEHTVADKRFVVNAGLERYPLDADITALGLPELARTLAALAL